MKQPLDNNTIVFENLKTKTIFTQKIEKNSKEADSYFIEQAESAEVGDILYKNFKLLGKGPEVKSKYKQIGYHNGNRLYKDRINYGELYIPDDKDKEGSSTQKILFGLKCNPSDKDHSVEYEDHYAEKLNWILRSNKQINMICCIPGHNANPMNSSTITQIITRVLNDNDGIINGAQNLIREKTVPAQKTQDRNERNIETHLNSIKVERNVQGKTIILIDDVVTSGSSMLACKKLLLDAGAKAVYCYGFAVAHTHWPTPDIWKK